MRRAVVGSAAGVFNGVGELMLYKVNSKAQHLIKYGSGHCPKAVCGHHVLYHNPVVLRCVEGVFTHASIARWCALRGENKTSQTPQYEHVVMRESMAENRAMTEYLKTLASGGAEDRLTYIISVLGEAFEFNGINKLSITPCNFR